MLAADHRDYNARVQRWFFGFRAALVLALIAFGPVAQADEIPAPQPYTRITKPDTNTVQLQIALRKFVPATGEGPSVWMAAVMHLGEPAYYDALQKFLDSQTVVLYEGVNAETHPHRLPHVASLSPTSSESHAVKQLGTNAQYSLQSDLAHSLGLVFQLDAIDYDRSNFFNSDLSIAQIQRILTESASTGGVNPTFGVLLALMDGSSFMGSIVKVGLQFLAGNPSMQAMVNLAGIDAVGNLRGDLSEIQGVPEDWQQLIKVLVKTRNQNLLDDLAAELKQVPTSGSFAVFYGAGHMDDLEKRVIGDLHYRPADEIWLNAFSVDLRKGGITPAGAEWMRNLIEGQMDQMHAK